MSWAIKGDGSELGRVIAATHVAEQTQRARDVMRWLQNHRPSAITDAVTQKVFGIVEAAMSVVKSRTLDASWYDYTARLREIRALCLTRIGYTN